ncbi:DUF389 domain-containing protein [Algoriphagus antarcticus]|uniref:DUF389 domain-containing protein n=1 Tax=Algoriphagus antarcticus TaxID=238540 RepID=UPI001469C009
MEDSLGSWLALEKVKSNAVRGVAIVTALICSAGYSLATMNMYFFFGAFYLLFTNSSSSLDQLN